MDEKTIVHEQVRTILAPLQNIALACGVLCAAYLLTVPVRRRCTSCEGVGPTAVRRSGRRFLCMLLSHPAFALVVLVLSLPASYWLYRPQERPCHHAWLLFWALYAIVRFAEGLLVELPVQMGRPCPLSRFARSLLRTMAGGFAGEVSEQQTDILNRASRRLDFLQKLIDDLLDLAAGKADMKQVQPRRVDLRTVVSEVVERLRPVISSTARRRRCLAVMAAFSVTCRYHRNSCAKQKGVQHVQ